MIKRFKRQRLSHGIHITVFWENEKLVTVELSFNKQNDKILTSVKRSTHPTSVMIWSGKMSNAKSLLVFIERAFKSVKNSVKNIALNKL